MRPKINLSRLIIPFPCLVLVLLLLLSLPHHTANAQSGTASTLTPPVAMNFNHSAALVIVFLVWAFFFVAFRGALLVGLGFNDGDGGFGGVSRFELAGDFCSPIAILTFPATMERSRLHKPSVFVYLKQTYRYNAKKITIYFLGFRGYGIQWGEKPRSEWDLCGIPPFVLIEVL